MEMLSDIVQIGIQSVLVLDVVLVISTSYFMMISILLMFIFLAICVSVLVFKFYFCSNKKSEVKTKIYFHNNHVRINAVH